MSRLGTYRWQTAKVRDWVVGGGIIRQRGRVLMVHNQRRGGRTDWSTPGGVIDKGETVLEGLTREVKEETGLVVEDWSGPVYTVSVVAHDMNWTLRVEVHLASGYIGDLDVDDPDGIVTAAEWVPKAQLTSLLAGQQPWMGEPLLEYLTGEVQEGYEYRYRIDGADLDDLRVQRL
ncbi:MAG: NUDIX hydrolase [Actinomycetota bacterium]|nr:NUDIX hydrolase [Actinomycetota bacterium]